MKTYLITERQTVYRTIEIEAETKEEALDKYFADDYDHDEFFEPTDFDTPVIDSIEEFD